MHFLAPIYYLHGIRDGTHRWKGNTYLDILVSWILACNPTNYISGVLKQTFRMTNNKVPAKETTYQCQYMELPSDRDYHLIATEPYIDNVNVMHHIIVYGCPDRAGKLS